MVFKRSYSKNISIAWNSPEEDICLWVKIQSSSHSGISLIEHEPDIKVAGQGFLFRMKTAEGRASSSRCCDREPWAAPQKLRTWPSKAREKARVWKTQRGEGGGGWREPRINKTCPTTSPRLTWNVNMQWGSYVLIFNLPSHGFAESKLVLFSPFLLWLLVFFVFLPNMWYLTISQPYH